MNLMIVVVPWSIIAALLCFWALQSTSVIDDEDGLSKRTGIIISVIAGLLCLAFGIAVAIFKIGGTSTGMLWVWIGFSVATVIVSWFVGFLKTFPGILG